MNKQQPVIKWSGSKRLLAEAIIEFFPQNIKTYYEPFLGGGSILLQLNPEKAVCVDINNSLIDFWNKLKTNPDFLISHYEQEWKLLQIDYKEFFKVRDRYNLNPNGEDLLFLSRTCVNGLIRYNKNGEFNNSLHYSRKGVNPETLSKVLHAASKQIKNYTFLSGEYSQIINEVTEDDFVYLDPPYFNTKNMYFGKIDYERLWAFLRQLNKKGVKYALSFDGTSEKRNYDCVIPEDLYRRHEYIKGLKSTFNKVIDKNINNTKESLYLNY